MNWNLDAWRYLNIFPDFLRRISQINIEKKLQNENRYEVTLQDVKDYFNSPDIADLIELDYELNSDLKFRQRLQIDICGGLRGCRFSYIDDEGLARLVFKIIKELEILETIENYTRRGTDKKLDFVISSCPNSCTKSQVADISIVGGVKLFRNDDCIKCKKCKRICPVNAIDENINIKENCIACGMCKRICPVDAFEITNVKYEILQKGKLGKVPKLAESYGIYKDLDSLEIGLREVLTNFKNSVINGVRFSEGE